MKMIPMCWEGFVSLTCQALSLMMMRKSVGFLITDIITGDEKTSVGRGSFEPWAVRERLPFAKSEITQGGKILCFPVIAKHYGSYLPVFLRDLY